MQDIQRPTSLMGLTRLFDACRTEGKHDMVIYTALRALLYAIYIGMTK